MLYALPLLALALPALAGSFTSPFVTELNAKDFKRNVVDAEVNISPLMPVLWCLLVLYFTSTKTSLRVLLGYCE